MFEGVILPLVAFVVLLCVRELSNHGEAVLVTRLTLGLLEKLGSQQYSVAIITPYNRQRIEITSLLHAR
jgi:hypothetical protein